MVDSGRQIFRFDTFASEKFRGDTLRLHEAVAGTNNGGVGPGVSPRMALQVGLKVDANAVPASVAGQVRNGQLNLDDPTNTLALLKLNAVLTNALEVSEATVRSVPQSWGPGKFDAE